MLTTALPENIRERIAETVRLRTGAEITNLHVELASDGIILTGQSRTYYCKQLATHAALDAAGNHPLWNEIEVN
ncbi:BON domain-containing protein [Calycomorphotria hydatis]|uniref:BON domain-containing protein n=1 Tax=Calycomorphotria hydatis TaxID=2528027 RepID=A0A517TEN0_9PLAN|nr:BON domain-containing protein [Calycomorphotria hydatis]QDT66829.1 hypothetical protein V22_41010 [Calycomorphotria hydatis]